MKRLLSITETTNNQTKKFHASTISKKPITCFENLSNQLLYEIFNYLDGCDIFDAFSNLNIRFQEFLNNSSFLYKIHRYSTRERTFKRYCKQIIIPNKHRIISLNLFDQTLINLFSTICNINNYSSFNHLESVILYGIKSDQLISFLINAINLPRLFSLNILLIDDYDNLNYVYKLIFNLPILKYIKFSTVIEKKSISLPFATNYDRISIIEYLNINHECTLDELNIILSYTPYLRRLICRKLNNVKSIFTTKLFNLRSIIIQDCDFSFNEFEIFIKRICSKLQIMRFKNRSNDLSYLDASRWEHLISEYIPDLYIFNFEFFQKLLPEHSFITYHSRINQFTTSFWFKHQWIFEFEINSSQINYSIHPYRKRWFDVFEITSNMPLTQFYRTLQLSITELDANAPITLDKIKQLSSWIRITRLTIDCSKISILNLIELLRLLPYADSLKILSISTLDIHNLIATEIKSYNLETINNSIIKLNIGLITDIIQVTFFLNFFPHIKCLKINCTNDINIELLVQSIIIKIINYVTPDLCSLCLYIGSINNEIEEKLHRIMISKSFLRDYKIKRVRDRIYMQWK